MFLKSLSIKGFKSFADPTVLELEPGITVVVGPNGSGKSNVVDAVTWVLGAQGPRALRSQKMEDVIFAGTSSRPALGRAEVSLTIDNTSGKLPVEMAEITITRTLFRSGDSEYAMNGTPCRLLDIQDLLSDSGVGRSQHMIIGQNQLDSVLTARPEERRGVIEEAAGVLKHRRRRERAERRLDATQENLERLGDLVRELRRQIRPLERQAAAARSHAAIAQELRAVRVHLAGRELTELAGRRAAVGAELAALAAEVDGAHDALASVDAESASISSELASTREQDLAGALGRVQALAERARGSANVLRERARGLAAALDAAADADVVATLDAEAARLAAELDAVEADETSLEPERASLAARAAELETGEAAQRREEAAAAAQESEQAAAALGDLTRRVEIGHRALEHDTRSLSELARRAESMAARAAEAERAVEVLDERCGALDAEAAGFEAAAAAAERDRAAARERARDAETVARGADQERHRSAARAEALGRALEELQGAGGRELLADVDGVVGALVDLVEVDPGWEAAFEAAAGAAVSAVVVAGRDAARAALDRFHSRGASGALLPARVAATGAAGPRDPAGAARGEAVRPHVRARGGASHVDGVLDALVGNAVRVQDWEAALDLALDEPDLVVVTADGDRFSGAGWRVQPAKGVVTAAAVEEALRRADDAAAHAEELGRALADARRALDEAGSAADAAAKALARHDAARAAARAERRRASEEGRRAGEELAIARDERDVLAQRVDEARDALGALEADVAPARDRAERAAARAAAAARGAEELAAQMRELAATRHALEVREAGMRERRRVLDARRSEVERRLAGHAEERREAAARRQRLEADQQVVARLETVVDAEGQKLERLVGSLRTSYADQSARSRAAAARMEALRAERTALEQRQERARERARVADREAAEVSLRTEALEASVLADLDTTPSEARSAPEPELPEGTTAAAHAAALAARIDALGPVNPLALDELSALEERHRELDTQMEDVRSARRQLHEVVRNLDREIAEQFASAIADVNEHFSALVGALFPGGTGRVVLTEPEDPLRTGVEIEVRPPGRNIRRVSLLSGGERSMAALAFLFAVFRSRPSPFYLMDEVEAALDDVNLHRFLALVHEFRAEAQLIIVSHQKRTMESADALYGVTMAPGGSSQVVSQRSRTELPVA